MVGGVLGVLLGVAPAAALGPEAPPVLTFASYLREGNALVVRVRVHVPGGRVPEDIQVATLLHPGGQAPLTLESSDLQPYTFRAGVNGVPGPHTVFVRDRLDGLAVLEFNNPGPALLPAALELRVANALLLPTSGARVLDVGLHPTPTVIFEAVPGAAVQQVVVREALGDAELFRGDVTGEPDEEDRLRLTLPGGIMVPGRRYLVSVEAYDGRPECTGAPTCVVGARSRSAASLELIARGPELEVTTAGGTVTGATLIVGARVANPGPERVVDAHGWIGLPDGRVLSATVTGLTMPSVLDGDVFSGPLFSHTFSETDPPGFYVIGARLVDPATGHALAQATRTVVR
jgi:hypothetical protein